eukprot:3279502-Pyramimonas_sp.AAC.1
MLSRDHHDHTSRFFVDYAFDSYAASDDHYPVVLDLAWKVMKPKPNNPGTKLDREKMQDPVLIEKYGAILDALEIPPWHTDVNLHQQLADSAVLNAARACFSMDRVTSIKGYVSSTTMYLVRLRRYVSRARRWLPCHDERRPPWADLLGHRADGILFLTDVPWELQLQRLRLAIEAMCCHDLSPTDF